MAILTLDPTGVKDVSLNSLAPRLDSLNGKRVGVLHNVKHNAKELLVAMADLLETRYHVRVHGPILTDGAMGMLATPQQLQEFAGEVDFALTGLGD